MHKDSEDVEDAEDTWLEVESSHIRTRSAAHH